MDDKKALKEISKDHVLYSKEVKRLILKKLNSHYDSSTVEKKWEEIQKRYITYLSTLPYLGGKGCRHNGQGGTYDCIALCAYYETEKDSSLKDLGFAINELYEMNNALFVPSFARMGKILDVRKNFAKRILHFAFTVTAKFDKKIAYKTPDINKKDEWPGAGYIMKVSPLENGRIYYRFNRCPIAEFVKSQNLLDIMPSFCNGDFPSLDCVNASLIRNHTCSNNDFCDFLIVGKGSEDDLSHKRKVDEKGYIYTDPIEGFKY